MDLMDPTIEGRSTTDTRTMALQMFADQVPCFFQLLDPSCEKAASWVAYFTHEENLTDCTHDMAWPVCGEHKGAVQRMSTPFWRMWLQMPPLVCEKCETPVRLDRIEAI